MTGKINNKQEDGMSDETGKEAGESKPRKSRSKSRMILIRAELMADAPTGATVKSLRKSAEKLEDGTYAVLCIRDMFTKETVNATVLKPAKG